MHNLTTALSAAAGNVGAGGATNPNAWDISYAELDTSDSDNYFNFDTMVFIESFSVASQEANTRGMFFKSDGTKMYIIGNSGDDVNEYALSTAWDPTTSTFTHSFSVNSQDGTPSGVHFKTDGTKMYVIGYANDGVYEYNLSTAWDVSSASYSQSFSVATQEITPEDLWFKTDGTKMYVTGPSSDSIHEYDLSTAWDISTASLNQSQSISGQETGPRGLYFKSDGTKMWVSGTTGDGIDEFSLSTAWDVSTISHVRFTSFNGSNALTSAGTTNVAETNPLAIFWSPDGDKLFMSGNVTDKVHVFKPGVNFKDVSSEETIPNGVFFKTNGTKMYVIGRQYDKVHEYDLSTPWDTTTASLNQSFSVNSQAPAPQGLFFKSDGTKLYVTGSTNDAVHEYDLTTGWDISTASFNQSFSVATQLATPNTVFFKDDGTKMYLTGNTSDTVHEYDLSTAWDVSTASYSQGFSVSAQEGAPRGLSFKDDGTKMYVCGSSGDDINEYDLSTAWDVSTASYLQNFYVGTQELNLEDMFFKPDGTAFWITGNIHDNVYKYNIRSS